MKFIKQLDKDHGCISDEYGSTCWLNSEDYTD
jgi:hypothetical protein